LKAEQNIILPTGTSRENLMGSIDGLREQVEELKQRLNDPGSQNTPESGELKTRLASIKASLESKQGEIDRLSAEKEKLAAEKEKLAAEREMLAAEREKISTEKQQLSADNDQLRKLLKEVLSALDGQPADASSNILSEFLAETDPLIKPNGAGPETVGAAGPAADRAAAKSAKAETAEADARVQAAGPAGDAPKAAGQKNAPQQEPDSDGEGADEAESPALRRIMRRGHRAAG
jgi:DNA repair exonuclease SbcCD ATPase subunit